MAAKPGPKGPSKYKPGTVIDGSTIQSFSKNGFRISTAYRTVSIRCVCGKLFHMKAYSMHYRIKRKRLVCPACFVGIRPRPGPTDATKDVIKLMKDNPTLSDAEIAKKLGRLTRQRIWIIRKKYGKENSRG